MCAPPLQHHYDIGRIISVDFHSAEPGMCRKPFVEMAEAVLKREHILALYLLNLVFRFSD